MFSKGGPLRVFHVGAYPAYVWGKTTLLNHLLGAGIEELGGEKWPSITLPHLTQPSPEKICHVHSFDKPTDYGAEGNFYGRRHGPHALRATTSTSVYFVGGGAHFLPAPREFQKLRRSLSELPVPTLLHSTLLRSRQNYLQNN